jgi:hypothetical protein
MTLHNPNKTIDTPLEIIKPYLAYIAMFVGMGLISGSIVHADQAFERSIILMTVGVFLFSVGSYIQEVVYKTNNIETEGVLKYILYSLMLAMGIGMISGSTQHFYDTPVYASYLLPIGTFLSSLGFTLRNNYALSRKMWGILVPAGLLFSVVLFLALNTYAKTLPENEGGHGHGGADHVEIPIHESAPPNAQNAKILPVQPPTTTRQQHGHPTGTPAHKD